MLLSFPSHTPPRPFRILLLLLLEASCVRVFYTLLHFLKRSKPRNPLSPSLSQRSSSKQLEPRRERRPAAPPVLPTRRRCRFPHRRRCRRTKDLVLVLLRLGELVVALAEPDAGRGVPDVGGWEARGGVGEEVAEGGGGAFWKKKSIVRG